MNALDLFYEICKIPHPSGNALALRDFIIDFAKKYHCDTKIDNANNIHIIKGSPKICLQAHYDMVLIGEKIEPIIVESNNTRFLKSKNSSLGADNGAALAAILYLLSVKDNIEAIITSDEEIGMIGAKNLALEIKSKKILNLDSENINEICIGCAGGLSAKIRLKPDFKDSDFKYFYEVSTRKFLGGHSGIDINKNIKNAIVELAYFIYALPCEIIDLSGGEKNNSIPVNAKAIIATNKNLDDFSNDFIEVHRLKESYTKSAKKDFLYPLIALHSGVYAVRQNNVLSSLNISKISLDSLEIMARANRVEMLEMHKKRLQFMFDAVEIVDSYAPWEAKDSAFLKEIEKVFASNKINYDIIEIHAGLECGILKEKCDEILSIGPTILNPHSKLESLDLKSFEKFLLILDVLI
ncbi:MAG: M20/M25/M40 family metallo-hydrolase [Helicobacteraceae bacterium]|nr:M20/M25/M40 family metallo-hydrolase [Helicobacteraceae bacterium]